MEHSCLPVGDFLVFLEIMKPLVLSAERIGDYVQIEFPRYTHMYQEEFGQVCHIMGIDAFTGEVYRTQRGTEL